MKKRGNKKKHFEGSFETLGTVIHEIRKISGQTQSGVGERAGTDKSYISKLENNLKDLRVSTLERILNEGLGVDVKFVLTLRKDDK